MDGAGAMKLKIKLAVLAVEERDIISDDNRRLYGEGFLAGFDGALEVILSEFSECKENDTYIEAPYSYFKNLGNEEVR